MHGISSSEGGLVQTVVDKFDVDIHSPNGKLSTHSLAMILTHNHLVLEMIMTWIPLNGCHIVM